MITETRVNIGPQARQIKRDGTASSHVYTDLASLKPELEAVTAVIADRIVTDAYNDRNLRLQTAIVLGTGRDDPFGTLEKVMMQDIGGFAIRLDGNVNSGKTDPEFQTTYSRFSQLLKNRSDLDPEVAFRPTPAALYGGLQTASFIMSESLRLIHDLGKGKAPEELVEIARQSYPLIVNLAAMHLEHFVFVGNVIHPGIEGDESFGAEKLSDEKFALTGEPGKERLGLTQEALEEIERLIELDGPETLDTPTTGCPALVNFGEGSAIRKLWDWHLELAERIYPALAKPEVKYDLPPDPTWGKI